LRRLRDIFLPPGIPATKEISCFFLSLCHFSRYKHCSITNIPELDYEKDVSTVLTSSGYGAISPIASSKVYRTKAGRNNRTQVSQGTTKFDSVTLSAPGQDSQFMGLVSRLSQEVRTATTTGDISALRQQVAGHTYTPDPMSIAARILMLGEGT
jgi:negative regulator of flagellin synthesis FlgM